MSTVDSKLIEILKLNSKFFVDIGSSCYTSESQTEVLINFGWSGIMFECDPEKYPIQIDKFKNNDCVKVIPEKVTPDNIIRLLTDSNTPEEFYLSIDIDGYDFYVIEKILEKYRPQFIISEINEKIPPPIKFSVSYDQEYFWNGSHYYGYSISMLEDILKKYSYKIESLDYNNVILIPGDQIESISDIYNDGYLNRSDRKSKFYYNNDFEEIYTMKKEDQINFINSKFRINNNKYQIS